MHTSAKQVALAVLTASALHCSNGPDGAGLADASHASAAGAATNPVIECLTPPNLTSYTLTNATVPVEVTWTTNVAAELASGALTLAWYDSSLAALGNKKATTPVTFELGYGEHLLTLALVTADGTPLPSPTARCSVRVRVTKACAVESDCADDFYCNVNVCDATTCKFGPTTLPGCCQHDFECPAGQHCDAAGHVCIACTTDAHCDDLNVCTTDVCAGGLCEHAQSDPSCCDCDAPAGAGAKEQCNDGQTCTVGSCNCDTNTCAFSAKASEGGKCCESGDDAACADGNPCTVDLCVANVCRNALQLPGMTSCCTKATDCNDGNACTTDSCDLGQNACVFAPAGGEGCCTTAAQCDDGVPSTLDGCVASQCIHTVDVSYCTVPAQSDVIINELMVNPGAVSDTTGEWIELYNATDDPIDLSGWSLAELGAAAVPVVLSAGAPLVIAPKGFLVLCRNGDPADNGGVTCGYVYGATYTLANDGDEVVLKDASGAVIDEVDFDGGPNFPSPTGASIALVNTQHDNNLGARWKASTALIAGASDAGTPGAANDDVFELFVVAACHEKPGDDVCTTDTCIDNHCAHIALMGCCNVPEDCALESACDSASCVDHACSLTTVPAPTCCLTSAVCGDGISCTVDVCIGNQCRHGPDPAQLGTTCCTTVADCGGGQNACVSYECSAATNTCSAPSFTGGAGCCTKNSYPAAADPAECDDGDPATRDSCKDYHCLYFPDPTYCDAQPGQPGANNCALDGDPCTDEACDVATKTCKHAPVADCCAFSPNCDDGNPCTDDTCSPKDSACVHIPVPGCCLSNQKNACDDGNACTTDACISQKPLPGNPGVSVGRCRSVFAAGCCSADAECDDDNACTADTCNVASNTCAHAYVGSIGGKLCCDPGDLSKSIYEQCDDGDPCSTPSCVDSVCVYTDVPETAFGACCDGSAADKGVSQCADGDPCTTDVCVYGRCRNLGAGGSCCKTATDCNDNVGCTTDACVQVGVNSQCTHTEVDSQCDDGKWCNGTETCDASKGCVAGVAPTGKDDGVDCTDDVCIEGTKEFVHNPNDGYCDDGKACSGVEKCDPALDCQTVGGADLDDGNPCTDDSCDDVSGEPIHVPNDAVCNDLLLCTSDFCDDVQGCVSTLLPAYCLIDFICWVQGAVNPASACQTCDTAKSQTTWSTKASTTEVCNGADDDCDGKIDEDAGGATLTQPCPNACGQLGIETCKGGAYADCTAPKVKEVCSDSVDNDCDGTTDEEACAGFKPGVAGCDLRFSSTIGQVENIVTDVGDGTYTTAVQDLANPNASGTTTADAYGAKSAALGFSVVALPPASFEVVALRNTLYVDSSEARFAVAVRDLAGRPPKTSTVVTLSIAGSLPGAGTTATCGTDAAGRCTLAWVAPAGAFTTGSGGQLFATITVGSVPAVTKMLTVVAKPAGLILTSPGAGFELPLSPRFPDSTFQVPVYLAYTAGAIGAYDMSLSFDPAKIQVVSALKGACSAFDEPVHNIGAGGPNDANKIGQVNLIGISNDANGTNPCSTGAKVHVVTLTFKVQPGLKPDTFATGAEITGLLNELDDIYISAKAEDQDMEVADMAGESTKGTVYAWSRSVMGILASVPDSQLLNWQPVTGVADTTQTAVIAYRRDFTSGSVAGDPQTTYGSTSTQTAQVSASGLVTAGSAAGAVTIAVTHQSFVSAVSLRVLQPGPLLLELSDTDLQPIENAPGGLFETAVVRAKLPWTDGAATIWTQDITPIFKKANVEVPAGVLYDDTKALLASTTAGTYTVKFKGVTGNVLASATLKASPASPVTCKSLQMLAPCDVQMLTMSPSGPSAQLAKSTAEAGVYAYLKKYLQTCQVQTYAQLSDGTRMRVTGNASLTVTSKAPSIAASTPSGMLTAYSGGQADLTGAWANGATTLCTGATSVLVDLPTPTSIVVTPGSSTIAISGSDPAATVKGLPTSQALTVKVLYADGTASDFTGNANTVYDAKSADPLDLLVASPGGLVTSTGSAAGTAQVKVSVSLYPTLPPATATVNVLKASGITAEVYEPYTPAPPRVTDHTFSYIELTKTWQDGLYEVIMSFSDGTTLDVTKGTIATAVKPGTATIDASVVKLDSQTGRVQALGAGIVDLVFDNGPLAYKLSAFTVDKNNEGIAVLVPKAKAGATFSGIKDVGTTPIETWCVFNDGTRRRLDAGNFVAGLLTFKSTVTKAATVDAMGLATIRGNYATIFQVDIASGVDVAPAYDPPAEAAVDANLLADCGDIDVGDEVGLAFKDQNPGATFTLGVRVNTCDNALGAFDMELTYDPAVLDALSAEADGASVGAIFSANTQSAPGVVLANANFNPLGGIKKGANLALMKVTFKAKKTGSTVSAMGGTLKKVVAIDAKTPIGPATPRAFVAGDGPLDPDCNGVVAGDVDGDCAVTAEDVRAVQRALLEGAPCAACDVNGDGAVTVRDAAAVRRLVQ